MTSADPLPMMRPRSSKIKLIDHLECGLDVLFDQQNGRPRSTSRRMRDSKSEISRGASPADGSSSISTRGPASSARPTASIWRSPPESAAPL